MSSIKTLSDTDAGMYIINLTQEHGLDDDTLLGYYESYINKIGLTPGFAEYLDNELKAENGVDSH